MTNALKGEVPLVLADGRTLTLVMDFEALIAAEAAYGKPLAVLMVDALGGYVGASRAILFGALRTRHPEITLRAAAEMLASDGAAVEAALDAASAAAFPEAAAEGGDEKNPPPVHAPRGKRSGGSGAKPGSTQTRSGGRPLGLSP